MRCLTREAFEAATPLAHGWGVETGMTIDLLRRGFRVVEVPCDLSTGRPGPTSRASSTAPRSTATSQLAVQRPPRPRAAGAVRRTVTPAQKPPADAPLTAQSAGAGSFAGSATASVQPALRRAEPPLRGGGHEARDRERDARSPGRRCPSRS